MDRITTTPTMLAAALDALATAVDAHRETLRVVRTLRHYKSEITFIGLAGEDAPRFVVKIEPPSERASTWSPKSEHEGLRYCAKVAQATSGFGAIEPIIFSDSPRFLVTRFQPGDSTRPLLDRAVRRRGGADLEHAVELSRRIGAWAAAFRHGDRREHQRTSPQEIIDFCRQRAAELRPAVRRMRGVDAAIRLVDRLLGALNDAERAELSCSRPKHGDLSMQNFLLHEGTLYPLDLEGFDFKAIDPDVAGYRARLEQYALLPLVSREACTRTWQAFLDGRSASRDEQRLLLLYYLHRTLATLAWETVTRRRKGRQRGLSWATRMRSRVWVANRLRWLRDLPESVEGAAAAFRDRL